VDRRQHHRHRCSPTTTTTTTTVVVGTAQSVADFDPTALPELVPSPFPSIPFDSPSNILVDVFWANIHTVSVRLVVLDRDLTFV
jgi:hypothetical protein